MRLIRLVTATKFVTPRRRTNPEFIQPCPSVSKTFICNFAHFYFYPRIYSVVGIVAIESLQDKAVMTTDRSKSNSCNVLFNTKFGRTDLWQRYNLDTYCSNRTSITHSHYQKNYERPWHISGRISRVKKVSKWCSS